MKKLLTRLVSLVLLGSFFSASQPMEAKRIYYDNSFTQWSDGVRLNSWGGTGSTNGKKVMTKGSNNLYYCDVNDTFKPENLEFYPNNDNLYSQKTSTFQCSNFNIPENTVFKGIKSGESTKLVVLPKNNELYLVGNIDGNGWSTQNAIQMETSDGLVYTKKVKFDNVGDFALITAKGTSSDAWGTPNSNIRYHSGQNSHKGINLNSPADMSINFNDMSASNGWKPNSFDASKEYLITVDFNSFTVKISESSTSSGIWINGKFNGHDWNNSSNYAVENGTYVLESSETIYFSFFLQNTISSGWSNQLGPGMAQNNAYATVNATNTAKPKNGSYENAFILPAGKYTLSNITKNGSNVSFFVTKNGTVTEEGVDYYLWGAFSM